MKIKLVNEQSRKRIEQLNSRLKILASDIHGEDKLKLSNNSQVDNGLNGLKNKNFFRSAANLHTNHFQMTQNNDYQLQTHQMLPSSPKFSSSGTNKPNFTQEVANSKYSSGGWSQVGSVKEEMKVKKQLKQIIQSKKEFHSQLKKELSELQKLDQMMIEQPESWDESGNLYDEMKKTIGRRETEEMREQMRCGRGSQKRKEVITIKQDRCERAERYMDSKKEGLQPATSGQLLLKTKTQQSMQQSMSQLTQQSPLTNSHPNPNPTLNPPHSPCHSVQSSKLSQYPNINQSRQNSISFNRLPQFKREQAEQLLREMMVIDFSESNIQSVLKLVEQESIRRSKQATPQNSIIKQDNYNPISHNSHNSISHSSISSKNNSSLLSMVNSRQLPNQHHHHDHIKQSPSQQEEQQKHYQLIHSYQLLSLVIKLKHFSKLKLSLIKNHLNTQKLHNADTFYEKSLVVKSFQSLKTHSKQSLQQQQMLFKIKTLYTQNMLKKSTLKQMIFNSKYKTFKFLSTKLAYQQQLKTKSQALNQLLSLKQQSSRYQQVSKLSESISKKSLFRVIKERYQKIRKTYQKYKLLNNVRKHRAWNHLFTVIRFRWVRKIIMEKDNNIQPEELYQDDRMSDNLIAEPSSDINSKILTQLNNYGLLLANPLNQFTKNQTPSIIQQPSSQINPINSFLSNQTLIQFNEPIVLHTKKSILDQYLSQTKKKYAIGKFAECSKLRKQLQQQKSEIQEKQQKITRSIILRNRKIRFVTKLKNNLLDFQLNQKLQYFCNIIIGSVPYSVQKEASDQSQSEQIQLINPLNLKYLQHHFLQNIKHNLLKSRKQKLQKEVYYDTIYGGNLTRRLFILWKSACSEMRQQKQRELKLKEQVKRQQQKLQREKYQQSIAYNQLQQQQLRLKEQQQKLSQQQISLRERMKKLKQEQEQLQTIEKNKNQKLLKQAQLQRQSLIKQEKQLKLRLQKLKEEENQRVMSLKLIEREIEDRQKREFEERKQREIEEKKVKQEQEAKRRQQKQLQDVQEEKKSTLKRSNQPQRQIQVQENLLQSQHSETHLEDSQYYQVEQSPNSYQQRHNQSIQSQQSELKSERIQHNQDKELQSYEREQGNHLREQEKGSYYSSQENQQEEEEKYDEQEESQKQKESAKIQPKQYKKSIDQQHQQQPQQQEQFSENYSEDSDKILNQYFTNQKPQTDRQNKIQQSQQGQQESPSQLQKSQLSSSLKMDDMMAWLGKKIRINQQMKDEKNNGEHEYHDEESHASQMEDDSIFTHMLQPQPKQQHEEEQQEVNQSSSSKQQEKESPQQSPRQQSQPQAQEQVQVQEQLQSEAQSQHQSSSHSQLSSPDLASSTSPSHLRLLSYAQNHHSLSVKRLIFNHVFKYQSYKKQETYQSSLLKTLFTSWKTFYQQKKSLKKYLLIYQNITTRINNDDAEEYQGESKGKGRESEAKRRESRSLQRKKHTESAQRYMSSGKSQNIQNTKVANQSSNIPQSQTVKYYPTSKQQKTQFQNLSKKP